MQTEKNLDSAARRRLAALFDDGAYTEVGSLSMEKDSLASVITAYGYVNGSLVYAFSQDNTVNSGAVGTVHAQKIAKLYSLAAKTGRPVVGIHDSNGAFIDGTVDSLNARYSSISFRGCSSDLSYRRSMCRKRSDARMFSRFRGNDKGRRTLCCS